MIIEESGMQFGDYPDDEVFHIERCPQYTKHLMSYGIKTCEFVLLRGVSICFVEAKKSCPNQISEDTPQDKKDKYNKYISDITTKFRHSLALYASILLERHDNMNIPRKMLEGRWAEHQFIIILVVKNADKSWLPPLREKLEKELSDECKLWKARLLIINEEQARKKQFII